MTKPSILWRAIAITAAAAVPANGSIIWNAPTTGTGNASDIVNTGTVVAAVYMGNRSYGVSTVSSNITVNGVSFGYHIGTGGTFNTYSNITVGGLTSNMGQVDGSGAPVSWDSGYAALTEYTDGSFDGANPGLFYTITGLTIGDTYEVQLFTPWWIRASRGRRSATGQTRRRRLPSESPTGAPSPRRRSTSRAPSPRPRRPSTSIRLQPVVVAKPT